MSVAAIRRVGGFQLRGPSPLLLMKSDQQLVALVRAGHAGAFDVVVGRYQSRLASFCRHMLGSREDAEDVLQEVLASAFDAMRTDSRPIELAPWLYRLARNRSLNHLRGRRARVPRCDGGEDALSGQPAAAGQSTAERVDQREQFRLIVSDIRQLAESQRSALVLREVEGLSHAQIAAVMETTVPAVKGLLVRARGTLAECVEARTINCEDVRYELCEEAEGLRRLSGGAKRHFKQCERCSAYAGHLRTVDRAMSSLAPAGLLELLKHLLMPHAGTHGGGAAASGGAAAGGGATAGTVVGGGASAGSAVGVGLGGPLTTAFGGLAVKATTGLTMAALLTAGATHLPVGASSHPHASADSAVAVPAAAPALPVGMLLSHSAPATASLGRLFTAAPARPAGKALLGRPHARRLHVVAPAAPTAAPLAPAPRPAAIAAPLPAAPAPAVIPVSAVPSEGAPVMTTAGGSNSTSEGSSGSSTPASQDSSGATTTEGSSSSGGWSGSSGGSSGSGTGGSSSSSSGAGSSSGSANGQSGTAQSGSSSGSSSPGSGSSSLTSGSGSTAAVTGSLPANVAAVVSTTVTVTTVTVTSPSNPSDGVSNSTSAATLAPTPTATSAAGTSTDAARTESTTGQ